MFVCNPQWEKPFRDDALHSKSNKKNNTYTQWFEEGVFVCARGERQGWIIWFLKNRHQGLEGRPGGIGEEDAQEKKKTGVLVSWDCLATPPPPPPLLWQQMVGQSLLHCHSPPRGQISSEHCLAVQVQKNPDPSHTHTHTHPPPSADSCIYVRTWQRHTK